MGKKIALAVGVLVLLGLLAGGVYFYMAVGQSPDDSANFSDTMSDDELDSLMVNDENIALPEDVTFETYTNEEEGITIEYPSDWTVSPGASPTVVVLASPLQNSNDSYQETVSIAAQDISASELSLEEFSTQATNALSQYMENLQITKQGDAQLDGEPAKVVHFSGTYPATDYLSETYQIYTVYDGYVYIITYTGVPDDFEAFMPTVGKMVSSFTF
ncbi:MAG: hypothetical protein CO030_02815 [Candidatus Magasanikbacteria bacterium CG_4_9_14_0_2_um_filter_42_11]|uniref:PsbP C-terminal domain-containing protein n=1 Tax=Candidatus Magasanikbacteria bacterium CG_4_9_14_0_2_um_filter_42_11 TaxID=1974643 RepID=A0A2M8F9Q5_9BACT|nr:MAG: hypothetical protein COU34_02315 [Candidatus Magasanikbacteria bacterium CG10_big_fil_rev_8_21_14_0_10_43_9]PIY92104.1 MAG: hypothetical protein COY70_05015 [Candidatus Magasanikbacteria bacterium CG_4_10_14_0_8_um_filter_42_12]PJC52436.1 MAG: hypothetical protein CO030_02815 [Candidatus Magasanikbacteria bacterium CG_4_9_14_0_2_um_filter_42_11]